MSGFLIRRQIGPDAELVGPAGKIRFFDLFYEIEGLKSGMHHPEGILWVRDARVPRPTSEEHVPLESIAPTILDLMQIPIPNHLKAASLLQGSTVHSLESV